jgi:hypothetical protein
MNVFVPIETVWREPTCLIAVGSSRLEASGSSKPEPVPLAEMAGPQFAGSVTVEMVDGELQLRARILDPIAITKVKTGVYAGIGLVVFRGPAGEMRLQRAALVDTPSASIGKSALLKIGKGPTVTSQKKSILCDARQVAITVREARDRRSEELRLGKAALPGGNPPYRDAVAQWQGTHTTAGGGGRDLAPFGQDIGSDRAQAEIRAALARPYAEAGGLITLLGSRHA